MCNFDYRAQAEEKKVVLDEVLPAYHITTYSRKGQGLIFNLQLTSYTSRLKVPVCAHIAMHVLYSPRVDRLVAGNAYNIISAHCCEFTPSLVEDHHIWRRRQYFRTRSDEENRRGARPAHVSGADHALLPESALMVPWPLRATLRCPSFTR